MTPIKLITTYNWANTKPLNSLKVLDLACGSGRNGAWFAEHGAEVTFVDRNAAAFDNLQTAFPHCHFVQADLEGNAPPALTVFDVVLVVNYLHRPLMNWIADRLDENGLLFYETFNKRQAEFGKPSNPDFLLQDFELLHTFAKLQTLHYFEGKLCSEGEPQQKAQLIAVNLAQS
ncbi:class I SAM-dependent methyltransferase [Shewanella yunxiaonensis]|uniref:Class I SAM-dependent methyltransferase n=1 Tax=Shewanella yunxiaonensis TaxID=2829809 RepID=A0ABX7YT25_9GAMM|nr:MULTISPECIES: class I SAM-dependent methyltransferase [Shewanella]MDF0533922.1 class I SAM-dependent methyltransferase [Shewanella sp. A32]QUN05261.1 class I SAM-dependent methyltransferase [Shewanella yunxiaonensis]